MSLMEDKEEEEEEVLVVVLVVEVDNDDDDDTNGKIEEEDKEAKNKGDVNAKPFFQEFDRREGDHGKLLKDDGGVGEEIGEESGERFDE